MTEPDHSEQPLNMANGTVQKKPPTLACTYPFVDDGWHWRCKKHIMDKLETCCGCGKKFVPTKPTKRRKP